MLEAYAIDQSDGGPYDAGHLWLTLREPEAACGAVERRVSASTQNQVLAALLFLYREVLGCDPGWLERIVRAKRPRRLPVVLTRSEVTALLGALRGMNWIMAILLYGAGLRLSECRRSTP